MAEAGIFVLSSRYEGFPNVLGEAMAAGLPVISTDCCWGPRDLIKPGQTGILVPPEDVSALAGALNQLLGDTALRKRLGCAAPQIAAQFSLSKILPLWDELIMKSLKVEHTSNV
jgi:glycosyltransferase involved in cell wall biosynthesis